MATILQLQEDELFLVRRLLTLFFSVYQSNLMALLKKKPVLILLPLKDYFNIFQFTLSFKLETLLTKLLLFCHFL